MVELGFSFIPLDKAVFVQRKSCLQSTGKKCRTFSFRFSKRYVLCVVFSYFFKSFTPRIQSLSSAMRF